ncbi:aftiphilin isoform X2 [Planococcus citri]|uniref:aftiphilin isoform X2 n=1 Tax=Planococcus citri TaxID=170843 RepID=UPI0031F88BF7
MANGIPPFLPATPPPMCNLDYSDDDDDDDFGEFSDAAKNGYLDDVSVTKSLGNEEVNNATQIFDPGTSYKAAIINDTSIRDDEFSFGDFVHQDIPVTVPVENESNFEDKISESVPIDDSNHIDIRNDDEKSELNCEPVIELHQNDSRVSLNDDDSSIEDSTSDNCNNDVLENETKIEFSTDGNTLEKNHIADNITEIEPELPLDSQLSIPEESSTVEDDFSAFCSVSEPKETLINGTNSEQSELKLQRAFSEDSDDSNTPDIDFSCFITCPQNLDSQQNNNDFADFESNTCDDDFGDFAEPVKVDFTIPPSTSTVQFNENIETKNDSSLEVKSAAQVTNIQSDNFSEDPLDDDFDDFVSTTVPSAMENAQSTNTEQIGFFDQSKSLKQSESELNSSQINVNQTTINPVASTSSSQDLEKMYDLSSECWNEIFQVSGEKQIEVNLNTFEGKLNGSCVWCKIKDIEASPALSYNWNDSETQKVLLSALYVDSRNILFGPRWNSDVPRFASNLGFSPLVPEKASEKKDTQPVSISPQTVLREEPVIDDSAPKPPATVPEAHFDWNNSGLTNPLDNRKNDRTKGSGASSSKYENSLLAKTPNRKELSEEAKEILNNLPNLYVMEKQYIVFPVS